MAKNTFYHQCPCAAGSTKTVSGHTCVPASIRFGDIGDTKSSILHDGPSEERDETEIAHFFMTTLVIN